MIRNICLVIVGLVSVGCGPALRFGVVKDKPSDPVEAPVSTPAPVVTVHNHMDLTPIAELVREMRAVKTEPKSELTPDAKPFEREPEAKPDAEPEVEPMRTPMPRTPDPEPEPKRLETPFREPEPAPAAEEPAVAGGVFGPSKGEIDRLVAAVDGLRQTVEADVASRKEEREARSSPKTVAEEPYKGAVIWTLPNCPPGELLKAHLRGRGWTVSTDRNGHFWERPSQGQPCPTIAYYDNGQDLGSITGYGGTRAELDAIDARHPLRTPPRNVPALVQPAATPKGEAWDDPEPSPGPSPNCAGSAAGRTIPPRPQGGFGTNSRR